jgi:uncharacterized lipoprotein
MILARLILLSLVAGLTACGGQAELKCEDGRTYLSAAMAPRVKAPDDLDDLEVLKEMPLPQASPQKPRPAGSPCLEKPPKIIEGL